MSRGYFVNMEPVVKNNQIQISSLDSIIMNNIKKKRNIVECTCTTILNWMYGTNIEFYQTSSGNPHRINSSSRKGN